VVRILDDERETMLLEGAEPLVPTDRQEGLVGAVAVALEREAQARIRPIPGSVRHARRTRLMRVGPLHDAFAIYETFGHLRSRGPASSLSINSFPTTVPPSAGPRRGVAGLRRARRRPGLAEWTMGAR